MFLTGVPVYATFYTNHLAQYGRRRRGDFPAAGRVRCPRMGLPETPRRWLGWYLAGRFTPVIGGAWPRASSAPQPNGQGSLKASSEEKDGPVAAPRASLATASHAAANSKGTPGVTHPSSTYPSFLKSSVVSLRDSNRPIIAFGTFLAVLSSSSWPS